MLGDSVVFPGKLRLIEVIPYLALPSNKDTNVSVWDFKQIKNLVIVFHHGKSCLVCRGKLREIAAKHEEFRRLEAEVLAVSFDTVQDAKIQAGEDGLRFPLLSDQNGDAVKMFAYVDEARKAPFPAVFITDRFGVLRYQRITKEADLLPDVAEIASWLLLIQTECPECSHL